MKKKTKNNKNHKTVFNHLKKVILNRYVGLLFAGIVFSVIAFLALWNLIRQDIPQDCEVFDARPECRQAPPEEIVQITKIAEIPELPYNCHESIYFVCIYDQTASLWEDLKDVSDETKKEILKKIQERCLDFVKEAFQRKYHNVGLIAEALGALTGYGGVPKAEKFFKCENVPVLPVPPSFPLLPEIPGAKSLGLKPGTRFNVDCKVHTEETISYLMQGKIMLKQWECVDALLAYNKEVEYFNTVILPEYRQKIVSWEANEKSREKEFLAEIASELDRIGKTLPNLIFRPKAVDKKTEFPCRRKGGVVKFEDCSDFTKIPSLAAGVIEDLQAKYGRGRAIIVVISDFLVEDISASENPALVDLKGVQVVLVEYKVSRPNQIAKISKMFEQAGARVTIRSF